MSLIYITGVPGVGKSTLQKELVRQGFEAYDIDQPRFGGPTNLVTGEPAKMPSLEERTAEWFQHHEWRVSRDAIEELKHRAEGRVVYLCGTATTEHLIWDLFDKIIYLEVDEPTLRARLAEREDNDFGKSDTELEIILTRYREAQEKMKHLGLTVVDARGDLLQTIQRIKDST